jgi:hypothetical protein
MESKRIVTRREFLTIGAITAAGAAWLLRHADGSRPSTVEEVVECRLKNRQKWWWKNQLSQPYHCRS